MSYVHAYATFCLSPAKLHATPQQTNSLSSAELHATPQHTNSLSSAELHATPQQTQITCCFGVVHNSVQQNSGTLTLNKALLPTNLFEMTGSLTGERQSKEPQVLQNIHVECSMDCLESSTDDVGLHTKVARLFHKIVGQNSDLKGFDALRLRFKGLKFKKF